MPLPPFSLAALTVMELTPPDMVSAAADAGYQHVGLRLIPATPDDHQYPVIGDTPMIRDILARLADRDISVLDIEVFRLKPDTQVRDFEAAMATGARIGARNLLVTGQDDDPQRLADTFASLCDLAAPYGLTANMEFMPWTEVHTLDQVLQLLHDADRPNAGVLLDALHVDRCQTPLADIARIAPERIRYIQLCDAPAERPTDMAEILRQARCERMVPGQGGLALRELLRSVPGDVPISLEVASEAWSKTTPPVERAAEILRATKALFDAQP